MTDHADRLTSTTTPGITALAYDAHGNTSTFGFETHVYDVADRHVETRAVTAKSVALIVVNPGALTTQDQTPVTQTVQQSFSNNVNYRG